MNRYPIICIEGPDKVGKDTQCAIIAKTIDAVIVKYPNYESETGKRLRRILDKKESFIPLNFQQLQHEDKARDMPRLLETAKDNIILLNRYTPSAYIFGMIDNISLEYLLRLNEDLLVPDVTIVLDGPPFKLDADIYETAARQVKVRSLYNQLAKPFRWHIVDATKSQEEVTKSIMAVIDRELTRMEIT